MSFPPYKIKWYRYFYCHADGNAWLNAEKRFAVSGISGMQVADIHFEPIPSLYDIIVAEKLRKPSKNIQKWIIRRDTFTESRKEGLVYWRFPYEPGSQAAKRIANIRFDRKL